MVVSNVQIKHTIGSYGSSPAHALTLECCGPTQWKNCHSVKKNKVSLDACDGDLHELRCVCTVYRNIISDTRKTQLIVRVKVWRGRMGVPNFPLNDVTSLLHISKTYREISIGKICNKRTKHLGIADSHRVMCILY